jgi:EAL and modified HD-GYP domain-containing signal transduction protein
LFAMPMNEIVRALRMPAHVSDALRAREGKLGQHLRLVESPPSAAELQQAGIDTDAWWHSQLHAYHWAIQVAHNV